MPIRYELTPDDQDNIARNAKRKSFTPDETARIIEHARQTVANAPIPVAPKPETRIRAIVQGARRGAAIGFGMGSASGIGSALFDPNIYSALLIPAGTLAGTIVGGVHGAVRKLS